MDLRASRPARLGFATRAICLVVGLASACASSAQTRTGRDGAVETDHFPVPGHYAALEMIGRGEFRRAAAEFARLGRSRAGFVRVVNVDSICYDTMAGEALYLAGDNAAALDYFNAAAANIMAQARWLSTLEFNSALEPRGVVVRPATWGVTARVRKLANYPEIVIPYGTSERTDESTGDQSRVALHYTIDLAEVIRCAALCLRRRGELLGPLAEEDPISSAALQRITQDMALPNHWAQIYYKVQLGMAFLGAGKLPQAHAALEEAIVTVGGFDHPLTGMVLLELGRLAAERGEPERAASYFLEASLSAFEHGDAMTVEEALRRGAKHHAAAHVAGAYPPLPAAVAWARLQRIPGALVSLLACAAESASNAGDMAAAKSCLTEGLALVRGPMAGTRPHARLNFAAAVVAARQGGMAAGRAPLKSVFDFQRQSSLTLFQRDLVQERYANRRLTPRKLDEHCAAMLADPGPKEWAADPIEALTSVVVPGTRLHETWFDAVLTETGDTRRAFEIAELAKRRRYLASLELGGRLAAWRAIIEAPESRLEAPHLLERRNLLARRPDIAEISNRVHARESELARLPLAPADATSAARQAELLAGLARDSAAEQALLDPLAFSHEHCTVVFPPLKSLAAIQRELPRGQAILSFFATPKTTHAFLISRDSFVHWKAPPPAELTRDVAAFLRRIGNTEASAAIDTATLANDAWRGMSRALLDGLMAGSKLALPYDFNELVIVPDGALWYVPFEALMCGDAAHEAPLVARLRSRYVPLAALASGARPRAGDGPTAVALGKLFPSDDAQVAIDAFDGIARAARDATTLPSTPPAPWSVYSTLWRRLIVLADIRATALDELQLVPAERGTSGKLVDWLSLPHGGPEQVVLPGFHTAAERSLRGLKLEGAGNELFFPLCRLMHDGAKTILISRWRPGGETARELVREFVQELPHTTAADAWQRSVLLLHDHTLDPAAEPRLRGERDTPLSGAHPFFWAGYMLVDDGAAPATLAP